MRLAILMLPPVVGCAKSREPVPEDVEGLSGYLFQHWEDPENLGSGMQNVADWLDTDGVPETLPDGYVLPDLTADEVMAVEYPDDPPLDTIIGVAVGAVSPYDILGHADLITWQDQTWNADSYDVYNRTIVSGDAAAFASGSGTISTENEIDKAGAFNVHIPYTLYKDYAWVELADGASAIVARSWTSERNCAENGNNCIDLSFSVDLFYGSEPGQTVRLTASWNKLTTVADGLITEDGMIGQMVSGVGDIMINTDAVLLEEGW